MLNIGWLFFLPLDPIKDGVLRLEADDLHFASFVMAVFWDFCLMADDFSFISLVVKKAIEGVF
jgi:hypothetical protein